MANLRRMLYSAYRKLETSVHPLRYLFLEIMRLLKQLGVPRWRLFSIFPKGRAAGDSELLLDKEGFLAMLNFIQQAKEEQRGQDFDLNFSCEGYLPKEWESKVDGLVKSPFCPFSRPPSV